MISEKCPWYRKVCIYIKVLKLWDKNKITLHFYPWKFLKYRLQHQWLFVRFLVVSSECWGEIRSSFRITWNKCYAWIERSIEIWLIMKMFLIINYKLEISNDKIINPKQYLEFSQSNTNWLTYLLCRQRSLFHIHTMKLVHSNFKYSFFIKKMKVDK